MLIEYTKQFGIKSHSDKKKLSKLRDIYNTSNKLDMANLKNMANGESGYAPSGVYGMISRYNANKRKN